MHINILTLSDRCHQGLTEDRSGPALVALARAQWPQAEITSEILPDEEELLVARLLELSGTATDESRELPATADLILTTGGTGLSPCDRTPEATRRVIDREIPGLAELMRAEGVKLNKFAALSRGLAGLCNQTLILNLPGSERGARESFSIVAPLLPHALDTIQGSNQHP